MFLKMITFAAASAGFFARDRSNEPVYVFAGGTSLCLIRWVSDRKIYWYENISPTACIFSLSTISVFAQKPKDTIWRIYPIRDTVIGLDDYHSLMY